MDGGCFAVVDIELIAAATAKGVRADSGPPSLPGVQQIPLVRSAILVTKKLTKQAE